MHRPRFLTSLAALPLFALVLTSGCRAPVETAADRAAGRRAAAAHADLDQKPYERWYEVWVSSTRRDAGLERRMAGYVAHAFTPDDKAGRHYVHDLRSRRVGFVTPRNIAYRFGVGLDGEVTATELTHAPLGQAVAAILGVSGSVELREINRPRASE